MASSLTVDKRFSLRPHLVAGLAALLVTGLTVHFFGQRRFRQETVWKMAPVRVRLDLPSAMLAEANTADARGPTKPLEAELRRPILLEQAWRELLREQPVQAAAVSRGSREQFTSFLNVHGKRTDAGYCIDLSMETPWPEEAAAYLRILAEQFVRRCRTERTAAARHRAEVFQAEARRAHAEYQVAQQELKQFEKAFLQPEPRVALKEPSAMPTPAADAVPAPPQENPQWHELQNALATVRNREAALLETITPSHPTVHFLRQELKELEAELAATSRWLSPPPTEEPPSGAGSTARPDASPTLPDPSPPEHDANRQDLAWKMRIDGQRHQLQQAVEKAATNYRERKEAAQTAQASPPAPLRGKIRVLAPAATRAGEQWDPKLLGLTLGSGLAMALGVCLISTGSAVEPLVARLADLQPLLRVPILGVVPHRDAANSPTSYCRRRWLCRQALIWIGLLLVFGSSAAIMISFLH